MCWEIIIPFRHSREGSIYESLFLVRSTVKIVNCWPTTGLAKEALNAKFEPLPVYLAIVLLTLFLSRFNQW